MNLFSLTCTCLKTHHRYFLQVCGSTPVRMSSSLLYLLHPIRFEGRGINPISPSAPIQTSSSARSPIRQNGHRLGRPFEEVARMESFLRDNNNSPPSNSQFLVGVARPSYRYVNNLM
ncbi:unnamed protein product [Nesidiocoris tenuis]|uniref:Uncharacterized protein n=1 Tax=Nesidiocoris tenuis TaxID=355587 RepID=A0A6H5GWQ1_9HEMI|nr:unnamed protein product [Nesidiocoris tenuis]